MQTRQKGRTWSSSIAYRENEKMYTLFPNFVHYFLGSLISLTGIPFAGQGADVTEHLNVEVFMKPSMSFTMAI